MKEVGVLWEFERSPLTDSFQKTAASAEDVIKRRMMAKVRAWLGFKSIGGLND